MNSSVPVLVAHRGYPVEFPENSLEGIKAALEAGACYIEFDVQISSDGVPVLLHDENLLRTANTDVIVVSSTLAQLKHYAVGEVNRFGNKYQHARMPTLAEVVQELRQWPRAQAFVEIFTL
jgi:glycerophosphoryl diester phosphodiesterase